jgi:hypothetical protein
VAVWKVKYEETRKPTIIRTSTGRDMPIKGEAWIDPVDGREMLETYEAPMRSSFTGDDTMTKVNCRATYSDFKRFETGARILREDGPRRPPCGALRRGPGGLPSGSNRGARAAALIQCAVAFSSGGGAKRTPSWSNRNDHSSAIIVTARSSPAPIPPCPAFP